LRLERGATGQSFKLSSLGLHWHLPTNLPGSAVVYHNYNR